MAETGKILVVDDNEDILLAVNVLLTGQGFTVRVVTDPARIPHFMAVFDPDVTLLDMNFRKDAIGGTEGFEWLEKILKADPNAVVVLMTAYADMDKAVQAIKSGAADFITKPWENDKLLATVNSALALSRSRRESDALRNQVSVINDDIAGEIVGESPAIADIFSTIDKLSETEANILILGENGTGKDLVARTIHKFSPRSSSAFITIDLGSIAESLFESELFGFEKGAFTDAKARKPGRIEIASGGTLFLDEISNLSMAMQAKLLTAIEKKYITRIGSTSALPVDVRLISASNADLYEAVADGLFRQDLLYRINTIEIRIPPLRERGNDINLLTTYFLDKFARKYKKNIDRISSDALRKLSSYSWPGNVRELQNVVERSVIMSSGRMLTGDDIVISASPKTRKGEVLNLETIEQETIDKAIRQAGGNLNKAADMLGITRYALYRKLKKNDKE